MSNYFNSGGIYDPIQNNWTSTSLNNVPDGRAYHTAIWTGIKMLVWGGIGTINNNQLNSGGIYDPLQNNWVSITLSNAPESREFHTGVWTGTKMIVWGGMYLGNRLNSGGIYSNPAVIGIKVLSNELSNSFSLFQNYPNPFNPTTKIKFSIPATPLSIENGEGQGVRNITLKIYDILGREVATLVNEKLNPGTYEVEWDASNYPSGIYFYKLTTDDASTGAKDATGPLSITKRMVLLK